MPDKISLDDLSSLFQRMRKAGWNMDTNLAWGYFFKHESKQPLQTLAAFLEEEGYEVLDINQSFPDLAYWLQVEKIEAHSEHSLNARNESFYELADKYGVKYDGMDVAPLDV